MEKDDRAGGRIEREVESKMRDEGEAQEEQ